MKKNKNKEPSSLWKKLTGNNAKCLMVILLGTILMMVMFCADITPERFNLKVGDIAYKTITASKDVVDTVTTEQLRDEAAAQVEPSYLFKEGVTDEVMTSLASLMEQLQAAQAYGQSVLESVGASSVSYRFTPEELETARTYLTDIYLYDYQLTTLLRSTDTQLTELDKNLTAAVKNTLNSTIREGYENDAISTILQIVGYKTDTSLLQNVVNPLLKACVRANMTVDEETTGQARARARESVEAVVYKQGQNIIIARDRVNENQLEMLRSLGLLDDTSIDFSMYVGAVLLVVLVIAVMISLLRLMMPELLKDLRKMTVIFLTMCLTMGACVGLMTLNTYLAPMILAPMMLSLLLGGRIGLVTNFGLVLIIGAMSTGGSTAYSSEIVYLMMANLISGSTAALMLRRKPQRMKVLLCGVFAAIMHMAVMLAIGMLTNNDLSSVANDALWSMGSVLLSAVLCLGLEPVMEVVFNLATSSKLMELSNPNQPLMRRLLLEAPGTYHHSIIVSNLAEAAAEAVGADPLLARAGGYYHDIGKLKRPLYFKENQMGENPHDRTDPYVSAAIVTAHTHDGFQLAQQYHLPKEIQNIISEHHGDTPVMYFYHKALQMSNGKPVDVADFRYDGNRPSTKESAIVMLADTVEAAVRSMPDPTPKAIEEFIERLVRGKLEDGQLSKAPITLMDIDLICSAFTEVLNGVFHERIEYPTVDLKAEEQRVEAVLEDEKKEEKEELDEGIKHAEQVEEALEKTEASVESEDKNAD